MINRIFMAVVLLSIAGGFISSIFLAIQKKIYKYTSANFVTTINTLVIFCFVTPFFRILSHFDQSSFLLKAGDLIVWVEQGTAKQAIYSTMEKASFADCFTGIWITGVVIYLLYEAASYFYFVFLYEKEVKWSIKASGSQHTKSFVKNILLWEILICMRAKQLFNHV